MPDIPLVDPQGRPWVAGSAAEANDLLAQGYRRAGTSPVSAPVPAPAPEPAPEPPADYGVIPTVGVLPDPGPQVEGAPTSDAPAVEVVHEQPAGEPPFGIQVS